MKNAILIAVTSLSIVVSVFLFMNLRDVNYKSDQINKQNVRLETENVSLQAQVKKYKDIDTSFLLDQCRQLVRNKYTQYIKDNSVAIKEGLTTTFTPKSDKVMPMAEATLAADEKDCASKFSN